MYSAIAKNKRNTIYIIFLFLLITGGLGFLASLFYQDSNIVIFVLAFGAIYALIQYFVATSLAVNLSGAIEIGREDNPRLYRIVENLTITTGMPMPKVYIINDPAPNAFATGRDPKHAIVAATTGLLDIMDDSELEGVMAHEISHVRNYDIRVSMIVFGLVSAIAMISDMFIRMAFFGRRNNNNNSPIIIVVGLAAMIIAPIAAVLVQAAVSRQREYLADASGALVTRYPEGLASALEKLEQHSRPMQKQNSSMSHLYISNPLKTGSLSKLFSTHPPLDKRITRLRESNEKF